MSYKDNLPKTMDELKAMSFDERTQLWAKYSQCPFKRQIRGGNPISKMSMHRILHDEVYIGQIENKKEGTFAKSDRNRSY